MSYYWGEPDISLGFCEEKYAKVEWVAEYYNTVTSLFYVLSGILFIRTPVSHLAWLLIGVGVGSAALHGTLRWPGQWTDEIAMLLLSFFGLRELMPRIPRILVVPLLLGYCELSGNFFFFFATFTAFQCLFLWEACSIRRRRKVICIYAGLILLATACWLGDQFLCPQLGSYHLHGWWHVLSSLAVGVGLHALLV
jgi:hypothetical protein